MKSTIANFAVSLIFLSASATFTSAFPAPTPAATGSVTSSDDAIVVDQARAQLRPIWRPGPRLDTSDSTSDSSVTAAPLAARGPVFRRNAESKFQYRKRTSAGLAVAANLAYNLGERDVSSPFGVNHVPLPVAMRLKREASLMERDDDYEEDWDCSEYDDDEEEGGDDYEDENPAESSSSWSSEQPAPSASASASDAAPQDNSNQNGNTPSSLLTDNVVGVKQPEDNSNNIDNSSSDSEPTPESTSEASNGWIAPAPTSSSEAPASPSSKKTKSKSKQTITSSSAAPAETAALTTPSDIAQGTFTVEEGCTRYHTVLAGEVCLGLLDYSRDISLTLEQLYSYNPAINSDCTNMEIGWGVCIGATPIGPLSSSSAKLLRKRGSMS